MIENNYIDLLRCKLRNNEHLLMSQEKNIKDIVSLKDIDVFIQLCKRFQEILHIEKDYVIGWCAQADNWKGVQFLIDEGYQYPDYLLVEYAYKTCNYKMTQRLFKKTPEVSLQTYFHAISSKDIRFVQMVFEHGKESFIKESVFNRECILVGSIEKGTVEIFKFVYQRFLDSFSLASIRKSFIINKELRWRLYSACIHSYDTYRYIFDNFDLSFTKHQAIQDTSFFPPLMAAHKGQKDIVQHMLENDLVNLQYQDQVATSAKGLDIYSMVKNHFKQPLTPSQSGRPIYAALSEAKVLVGEFHIGIRGVDLVRAVASPETFKYLLERVGGIDFINQDTRLKFLIIQEACIQETTDMLEYLETQSCRVNDLGTRVSTLWHIVVDHQPNNSRRLRILFSQQPPTQADYANLTKLLDLSAAKSNNFKVFKYIFDTLFPLLQQRLSTTPDAAIKMNCIFSNCFVSAAKRGRLLAIRYLYQHGLYPIHYTAVLENSASIGSLAIVKFVIENTNSSQEPLSPTIIRAASNQNHHYLVKYLSQFFPNTNHY